MSIKETAMRYGSMINLINGNSDYSKAPVPEVGMGATILCWSDRHAATIVKVYTPKKIGIKQDKATRVDKNGMTDSGQHYEYSPVDSNPEEVYTLRKNGRWVKQGETATGGGNLAIGYRDEYYDYSF